MISEYAYYNSRSKSKYNRRGIDGKIIGCSRCVGYCKYNMHPGFLTSEMRKVHRCIEKGCNYYLQKDRYTKHNKGVSEDCCALIENSARKQTAGLDGMRVMRVVRNSDSDYSVHYIAITNCYALESCAKKLSQLFGYSIRFKRLDYDFDTCVKLIFVG